MTADAKTVSRRFILKGIGASLAFASCGGVLSSESAHPISTFVRLGLHIRSAEEVVRTFVRADSAFLMASYAVFFREFLDLNGLNSINLLQVAADKYKESEQGNHHRLDALPS